MSDAIEFELPGTPANDNARRRWHWARRYREDGIWQTAAYAAAINAKRGAHERFPWDKVRVTYTFVYPDRRRRDPDNRMASTKPILDGVVAAGVMPDDSDDHVVGITTVPAYERGRRCIRIIIEKVA